MQAVISGLRAPHQARQVDELLRSQADVIAVRTDFNTRNLMMQVRPWCVLDQDQLRDAMEHLGLGVRCYQRGPMNGFQPMDPRDCPEIE